MDVSRRAFLQSIIASSVVVATPSFAMPKLPVLHGDGVSDDAPAFQAYADGEPFIFKGEVRQRKPGEPMLIPPGTYRFALRKPLTFRHP